MASLVCRCMSIVCMSTMLFSCACTYVPATYSHNNSAQAVKLYTAYSVGCVIQYFQLHMVMHCIGCIHVV